MISVCNVLGQKHYDFVTMVAADGLDLASATETQPDILLSELGWTLYELDYAKTQAVFLDVGAEGDIIRVPFAYGAQMRLAKRAAFVPFADFLSLGAKITPSQRIIQLYNIGHCGSTLLHQVLNASDVVWDISEPKFVRDIAMNRAALPTEQQTALAKTGIAFLSLLPMANQRKAMAIKHFSQATKIYDILNAAWPSAANIYMYRDAISWCNSDYGFWQRWGMPAPMPFDWRQLVWSAKSGNEGQEFLDGLIDFDRESVSFTDLAACGWGLHSREFLAAREQGIYFFALRYDQLLADREGVLKKLLSYCGLKVVDMAKLLAVFDHDAHEGEKTSHDKPVHKLPAGAAGRIREILAKKQLALDPDQLL